MLGFTARDIGIILVILFVAAGFDFWRGKLATNLTPKRLAVYGVVIFLSAVFFWNTIEERHSGLGKSRSAIPASR